MKSSLVLGMGVVLSLGVTACGSGNNGPALVNDKTMAQCPSPDTVQCGYGCVAATTTCCNSKQYSPEWDIGTFECPGTTVAQCVANTGSCGALPAGGASQYCCSTQGSFGSIDCKGGTVACNQNCVPFGSKCCSMIDPTNCGTVGGAKPPSGGNGCTFTEQQCCAGSPGISAVECAVDNAYIQSCGCPTGTTKGGASGPSLTWCICP